MSAHPSSLDLQAVACGEATAHVDAHLASCEACRAYVERVSRGRASFDATLPLPAPVVALAAARRGRSRFSRAGERWFVVVPALAAAAAAVLWLREAGHGESVIERSSPTKLETPTEDPDTTFKGGLQLAVVRERQGEQRRFTAEVAVRPGDRLRVEVALDRPETLVAGVLGEDGDFLTLMALASRGSGTHFSEQAARVDDEPTRGWLVVGTAESVARSRAARAPQGVAAMRITWEADEPGGQASSGGRR